MAYRFVHQSSFPRAHHECPHSVLLPVTLLAPPAAAVPPPTARCCATNKAHFSNIPSLPGAQSHVTFSGCAPIQTLHPASRLYSCAHSPSSFLGPIPYGNIACGVLTHSTACNPSRQRGIQSPSPSACGHSLSSILGHPSKYSALSPFDSQGLPVLSSVSFLTPTDERPLPGRSPIP
jgi:hypothetical protein